MGEGAREGARKTFESDLVQVLASLAAEYETLIKADNDRAVLAGQIAEARAELDLYEQIPDALPPVGMEERVVRWTAADLLDVLVESEERGANARIGPLRWLRDVLLWTLGSFDSAGPA